MNLDAQIAMRSLALPIKAAESIKYKEAKLKARAAWYAEALKNKPENKDKEKAQKIANDAQTQIKNNLEIMLTSHFKKLEGKIEQITKWAT